jgi:hypothetical protein
MTFWNFLVPDLYSFSLNRNSENKVGWGFLKKDIYKCPKSKSAEGVLGKGRAKRRFARICCKYRNFDFRFRCIKIK